MILRHPRWFWLSVLAWVAFCIAFPVMARPIADVSMNVAVYGFLLVAISLAGRALVRFQRKHRRGVPAR